MTLGTISTDKKREVKRLQRLIETMDIGTEQGKGRLSYQVANLYMTVVQKRKNRIKE